MCLELRHGHVPDSIGKQIGDSIKVGEQPLPHFAGICSEERFALSFVS